MRKGKGKEKGKEKGKGRKGRKKYILVLKILIDRIASLLLIFNHIVIEELLLKKFKILFSFFLFLLPEENGSQFFHLFPQFCFHHTKIEALLTIKEI